MYLDYFSNVFWSASFLVACASAYRAGAFVHEIIHQKTNVAFKHFTLFWNLTVGAIALYPSPAFNLHLKHHTIGIFGTKKDPQYPLLFKEGKISFTWAAILFIVLPLTFPLLNVIRVIITPWALIFPSDINKNKLLFLFRSASLTKKEALFVKYLDCYYFFVLIVIVLTKPLLWYAVVSGAWFLSGLRIPLEHKLQEHKTITTKKNQIEDSFNFKRSWSKPLRSLYSFIVQPLGLNWHQKHHANPSLFYYKLRN